MDLDDLPDKISDIKNLASPGMTYQTTGKMPTTFKATVFSTTDLTTDLITTASNSNYALDLDDLPGKISDIRFD